MKYITSLICICCLGTWIHAQDTTRSATRTDSLSYQKKYGLRLGTDFARIIRTGIDKDYTGFELQADYRISSDLYIAGEIGYEDIDKNTDRIDHTTTGSYFKAGVDYNLYDNWLDMDNMIYAGGRIGTANMSQTLRRFEFNSENDFFPIDEQLVNRETSGLTAIWLELQIGAKVELIPNLYMVLNAQLKYRITQTTPDNFDNLYIPGYGRTYDTGDIGVGYFYGLAYRIPFYKK